jgi:hypothetical protein
MDVFCGIVLFFLVHFLYFLSVPKSIRVVRGNQAIRLGSESFHEGVWNRVFRVLRILPARR